MSLNGLNSLSGKNLMIVDLNSLRNNILKSNFLLKDVTLIKRYPDTIEMTLIPRQAAIIMESSPSALIISSEGVVIRRGNNITDTNLPLLTDSNITYRVGDVLRAPLRNLISLEENLRKTNLDTKMIMVDEKTQTATIVLSDDTQILVSTTGSYNNIPPSLQIIISRFRIEGIMPSKIDFRFDRPIVTLENGEKISP